MAFTLKRATAQNIVETVKDVCGCDINFINTSGIIFASTNSVRIGEFHEIGKKAAEIKEIIEVQSHNNFFGTDKGVNIPFFYNQEMIAVIGISGEPDEVRRYVVPAQKIASMILRENELDSRKYREKDQINYALRALFENHAVNYDFLKGFMSLHKLSVDTLFYAIVIKLCIKCNSINLSLLEASLYQTLEQIPKALYTSIYPDEYWLMLPDEVYQNRYYILQRIADAHMGILSVGVGNRAPLSRIFNSYQEALIAVGNVDKHKNFVKYEDLTLGMLLGALPRSVKKRYLERTISGLDGEDIHFLKIYYSANLSIQWTAAQLFLHKNTVQYRLNRINKITGLNPRVFEDAVVLYLALSLQ